MSQFDTTKLKGCLTASNGAGDRAELGFQAQRMNSVKAKNSCRNTNWDLEAVTNILATCFPLPNNFFSS